MHVAFDPAFTSTSGNAHWSTHSPEAERFLFWGVYFAALFYNSTEIGQKSQNDHRQKLNDSNSQMEY